MSYKDAGVDIEAGDALVEAIKPLARSTARDGCVGGIGGFGALFQVKRSRGSFVLYGIFPIRRECLNNLFHILCEGLTDGKTRED